MLSFSFSAECFYFFDKVSQPRADVQYPESRQVDLWLVDVVETLHCTCVTNRTERGHEGSVISLPQTY